MNPSSDEVMEDLIILDSDGRRIVRDGKEYPLSEEEYSKLRPLHKDVDCKDCTRVDDIQDILLYFATREMKDSVGADPVFIGNFCLSNFAGHCGFYLFRCYFCGNPRVSYICGGGRRLWCSDCKEFTRLDVVKHRDILIGHGLSGEALKHYEREDSIERRFRRRPYIRTAILFIILLLCYIGFKILN